MLPQISYSSSNFPNASAASPCSPLTSSSIFIHFFIFVSFLNLLLLLHSDGGFGLFFWRIFTSKAICGPSQRTILVVFFTLRLFKCWQACNLKCGWVKYRPRY